MKFLFHRVLSNIHKYMTTDVNKYAKLTIIPAHILVWSSHGENMIIETGNRINPKKTKKRLRIIKNRLMNNAFNAFTALRVKFAFFLIIASCMEDLSL